MHPPIRTILGTQYYRPPNPPPDVWAEDLPRLREAGISVVRVWLHWSVVNPEPGRWEFGDYDRLFDLAASNQVGILLQFILEAPPRWLIEAHPEARWQDMAGKPVDPGPNAACQAGDYPGLCLDVPAVWDAARTFMETATRRFRGHQALWGWDVWNEIMPFYWPSSVFEYLGHPETVAIYRRWLADRYGSIGELNNAYGRQYPSFEAVRQPTPDKGVFIDRLDFIEFGAEWIRRSMCSRVETVRQLDPDHPIGAHPGTHDIGPFDAWDLAEVVDFWGVSSYQIYFWKTYMYLLYAREASAGKPWGVVEMTGGRTWYGPYGNLVRSPEFAIQQPLLGLSLGGKLNLFWQYRPERFGSESPNFGWVREDGSRMAVTDHISALGAAIQTHQELFDNLVFPACDVGLVVDLRTQYLELLADLPGTHQFATLFEIIGYLKALTAIGARVQLVSAADISRHGVPAHLKLLVAPLLTIEQKNLGERLTAYVQDGGTLMAGPYLFVYDSLTYMIPQTPPSAMQVLFGARREDLLLSDSQPLPLRPLGGNTPLTGYHALEVYGCAEAEPWVVYGEKVVGTRRRFGEGFAYRLGTLAGTPIGKAISYPEQKDCQEQGDGKGLERLLDSLLTDSGCVREPAATGDVVIRSGTSNAAKMLFLHNAQELPQTVWVTVPADATDLLTGERVCRQHGHLVVPLKARESRVFCLAAES